MRVREKWVLIDYQSGNSQGILIHVLGINPVNLLLVCWLMQRGKELNIVKHVHICRIYKS